MREQTLKITINKPVENVFAFTINPENTPKWIDAVIIEETNEWPPRLGTIYRNKGQDGTWRELQMTTYEENKTFVMSSNDGFHIRYHFSALDENTTKYTCTIWMDEGELQHTFTMEVLEKLKQQIETAE